MATAAAPPAKLNAALPLIAEKYVDVPSQRLYILSLGLLCQAIKVFDWLQYLFTSEPSTNWTLKWIVADGVFCLILNQLRIPRLHYSKAILLLQIFGFWFLDGMMFGGIQIAMSQYSLTAGPRNMYRKEMSTTGRMVNVRDVIAGDDHLKGEHTVRMSPISTAKLNPYSLSYCLSAPSNSVLIPILFNNTKPTHIRYSISSSEAGKVDYIDLTAKDLKAIEHARVELLQLTKASPSPESDEDEDDYDPDDVEADGSDGRHAQAAFSNHQLEKTQSVAHIKVSKPGVIRVEAAYEGSSANDARIFSSDVLVVPCPKAKFVEGGVSRGGDIRCAGTSEELTIQVFGVPPLSLKWHKEINGRKEYFSVDGIEGSHEKARQAQQLNIPLTLSLDVAGRHIYMLDGLADGAGNSLVLTPATGAGRKGHLTQSHPTEEDGNSDTTRALNVLRRASMSFGSCGPGRPASLLVGSQTQLPIVFHDMDPKDEPWEVTLKYQPPSGDLKSYKPWKKTLKTSDELRDMAMRVAVPGEYTIVDVKGRVCPGDVLSPDTCKVVEQPYPTAEIEWKRIHECSGDTGVSAYLVLHGKPPFQVYYQQRRNNEPPKEMGRTFQGSRGEITLQPESSGNYTYTFVYLNDANYKRVELDGPSITQVVHPPASGSFAGTGGVGGQKSINSCSGNFVDVDVNLRGKGPWNLEVQIVGPRGSQNVRLTGLTNSRETLRLPIPTVVDEEGGTFQVDLVNIEDAYGCKKDLAVPGIAVNVRRVKPTVKFFAKDGKRTIIVLEKQPAELPLRLTGDGPWRVRYRRTEPPGPATTVVLSSPNGHLRVQDSGIYHLLEVSDSQCPGSVLPNEDEFKVDWVPRPSAKLWPGTEFTYEAYNGSHIRPPICEGKSDHVDLELTGRPPFQIMYNVARDSETGGTRILDQPVISSIQPRTRFQLHTAEAGRIYYEVKQIGDAAYPLAQNKHHVIPRYERLLFEQEVLARPTAYFKSSSRLSRCLDDTFVPRDPLSTEGTIIMEGRPPFLLDISIKNLAASEIYRQTVELWDSQWRIDLPTYAFKSIGPHLVTIESVGDISRCDAASADPLKQSIWVDVAETAAIVPFDRREHFCVGEITQFQLEGTPPWTIGYKVNRKYHEQAAKQSPFALVQQQPGNFSVTSISHQHKLCKTAVDNINFQVHALPSAQVAQGRDHFENIHEGSQAQIIFTLIGEPPFTFTYQRSEPPPRKGAKLGKVLETHTVSGVNSHEYSIYSALEGTWTVTFISDKYCRYPPAQPDGASEKAK